MIEAGRAKDKLTIERRETELRNNEDTYQSMN